MAYTAEDTIANYTVALEKRLNEIRRLESDKAVLLGALEAIGSMHTDDETDYGQLFALCVAVALTTIKEMQS